MLPTRPASSRYLHEAHAITRAQLDALEVAGALVLRGRVHEAAARLAEEPAQRSPDRTTPLDVAAISASRQRAIEAARRASLGSAVACLEGLSLAPREVSAWAEMAFVRRAHRLVRLIELEATESVVASEIELLAGVVQRLDSLHPPVRDDDEAFLPDGEIVRFADPRFDLSLGSFVAILDGVAKVLRERRPADGSEVLALGGPLVHVDFANPPAEIFERAIRERGAYDPSEERAHARYAPHGPWLEWSVVDDGAESIEPLREIVRGLRSELRDTPRKLRAALASSIECDFAPFVTCDDWMGVLDARLVRFELELTRALELDLVVLSRVMRDPSY